MENINFNSVVEEGTTNYGVYKIICLDTGREYIGSGKWKDRFTWHINALRGNYHRNKEMQNDFNIYGEDSFNFVLIKDTIDTDPRPLEDVMIKEKFDSGNLYNVQGSAYGPTFITEEAKQKMSEVRKGRKHAESTRKKMSESMKGKRNGAKVTIEDAIEIINYAKKRIMLYEFRAHLIKDMAPLFNVSTGTIKTILGGRHSLSPQLDKMGVKF